MTIQSQYDDDLSQFDDDDIWEGCFPTYLCQGGGVNPNPTLKQAQSEETKDGT